MDGIPSNVLKPSLEYLHQYLVDSVQDRGEGWAIVFENGAEIENLDPRLEKPQFPEGLALLTTTYAKSDTTLIFGRVVRKRGKMEIEDERQVALNPTEYKLTDPRFAEAAFPQRGTSDDVGASPASEE